MASNANNSFVDRGEIYLDSPEKSKIEQSRSLAVTGKAGPKKVSSTSWQVSKTTVITKQEESQRTNISTAEFRIQNTGREQKSMADSSPHENTFAVSSEDESEQEWHFVDRTEISFQADVETLSLKGKKSMISIPLENGGKGSASEVDRNDLNDKSEQQTSLYGGSTAEAKISHLSQQETVSHTSDISTVMQTTAAGPEMKTLSTSEDKQELMFKMSENLQQTDDTAFQRVTYTPGLAMRDFALEELREKRISGDRTHRRSFDENENLNSMGQEEESIFANSAKDSQSNVWSPKISEQTGPVVSGLTRSEIQSQISEQNQPVRVQEVTTVKVSEYEEKSFNLNDVTVESEKNEYSMIDNLSVSEVLEMCAEQMVNSQKVLEGEGTRTAQKSALKGDNITLTSDHNDMSWTSQENQEFRSHEVTAVQESAEAQFMDSNSLTSENIQRKETIKIESQDLDTDIKPSTDAEQKVRMVEQIGQITAVEGGVQLLESQTEERSTTMLKSQKHDVPTNQSIEIERKFNISPDTEEKLKTIGAKLIKSKSFTDVYYDNSDYILTLSDCWLRQRDNGWEMKISIAKTSVNEIFTQYQEIMDEAEIVKCLIERLKLKGLSETCLVKDIINTAELTGFAEITTTRKTFALPECTVDLDLTDYGFQVGEIEVLASSEERIPAALKTIEDVATKLGLSLLRLV